MVGSYLYGVRAPCRLLTWGTRKACGSASKLKTCPFEMDLSPEQEIAALARTLFFDGYYDHLSRHITYKQADGSFLVNPWGLAWREVCAGDIACIDREGWQLAGRWQL